jgi:hypothetical protein
MGLLSGAVFSLFGLVLFLFSNDDGFLRLKWNSAFWPFYLGLGAVLLILGFRAFNRLPEE